MSPIDMRKLAALAKKNAEKAAKAVKDSNTRDRRFDQTLPKQSVDQEERERFFKEMQKREF